MKKEILLPFVESAVTVVMSEVRTEVRRGQLYVRASAQTAHRLTIMVGVTGSVQGAVFYGLAERTACAFAGRILHATMPIFDEVVQSGIAEMGNVITGRASVGLDAAGFPCRLTPPTLIVGEGVYISTLTIRQMVIPLETDYGRMDVAVALREAASDAVS